MAIAPVTAPAEAASPGVRPEQIIARVAEGTVEARVPMIPGKAGVIRVHPDTWAVSRLVIKDGKIDRQRTEIAYERSDGTPVELDGPLWWDASRVYIDEQGRFRTDVFCWPDPDVTEQILGPGHTRIPDDPVELLRLMAAAKGEPSPGGEDTRHPISKLTDVSGTQTRISGRMAEGTLDLGAGSRVVFGPQTRVEAHGGLDDLSATLHLDLQEAVMMANGTEVRLGRGQAEVRVETRNAPNGSADPFAPQTEHARITFAALNVEDLRVRVPAAEGDHELEVGSVEVRSGDAPLLDFDATADRLQVQLPEVTLRDIGGRLLLEGSDGQPAVVSLGGDLRASVELDSAAERFAVHGEATDLRASVDRLALVDAPSLDLDLRRASLSGSGRFDFEQRAREAELSLDGPFRLDAQLANGLIGGGASLPELAVDLGETTGGSVELRHLTLGSDGPPVFDGAGRFDVLIDEARVPLPSGTVTLGAGTRASLELSELGWNLDAPSPHANALLRIRLPEDIQWSARELDGMRVEVDAHTGQSSLVVQAQVFPDGRVEAAAGIRLIDAELRARVARGEVEAAPEPTIEPIDMLPSSRLQPVRALAPRGAAPERVVVDTVARPPALPPMSIRPADVFNSLDDPSLDLRIPTGGLVAELFSFEVLGKEVYAELRRGSGEIRANFVVQNERVVPERSGVVLAPPLEVRIEVGDELVTARVEGLSFVRDPDTGRGMFHPRIDWPGDTPAWLERFGIRDRVNAAVGEAMALALVGDTTFPLQLSALQSVLGEHFDALDEPIEIGSASAGSGRAPRRSRAEAIGDTVLRSIRFEDARLEARTGVVSPGRLELGDGQYITIEPGSHLRISGSSDDFVIEGRANLGGVSLGGDELAASLGSGRADLRMRVVRGAQGEEPSIVLELAEIRVDDLEVTTTLGELHTTVQVPRLERGSLRLERGGHRGNQLHVDLPRVEARIATRGMAAAAGTVAQIDSLAAVVEGRVRIANGEVSADLDRMGLVASGGVEGEGRVDELRLSGAGRLAVRADGSVEVRSRGEGPELSARMGLPNGTQVHIPRGTVGAVTFTPTRHGAQVALRGLESELSVLAPLPGAAGSVLDVRSASVSGDLVVAPAGVSSGELALENLDASVTNIGAPLGAEARVDLQQVDVRGAATLRFGDDGGVELSSASGLEAVARARDLTFALEEPAVEVDLAAGAQMQLRLTSLHAGAAGQVALGIRGGAFTGEVERGTVQLGASGQSFGSVEIEPGTRVALDLDDLRVRVDARGRPSHLQVDATLRLDGALRVSGAVEGASLPDTMSWVQGEGEGRFRMAARALVQGPQRFAVSSVVQVDALGVGSAGIDARTLLDGLKGEK